MDIGWTGWVDKGIGILQSVIEMIGKSTLDKTEKEKLIAQVELAKLTYELESMRVRMAVPWMKWVALGSGVILGLMIINNYIVLPYVPAVQSLEIPHYLWIIFGTAIGADKLFAMVEAKKEK